MSEPRGGRAWPSIGWDDIWPPLLAAALLVSAVRPLMEWWQIARLLDRGSSVPAKITSTTIDASGRYSVDVVRYEFRPLDGAAPLSGVERYTQGPTPDLDPGELAGKFYKGGVNALYLAEDPRAHRLDLGLPRQMGRSRWWGLVLLAAAVIVGTVGAVRLARRRAGAS